MGVSVSVSVSVRYASYWCQNKLLMNKVIMFDFEKLEVYKKIRKVNIELLKFIYATPDMDPFLRDQLKRASLSILLNLSEGTGRMSLPDKKRFLTIARSSTFETVTILQVLLDLQILTQESYDYYYNEYTSVSKMLLAMFRSYNKEKF